MDKIDLDSQRVWALSLLASFVGGGVEKDPNDDQKNVLFIPTPYGQIVFDLKESELPSFQFYPFETGVEINKNHRDGFLKSVFATIQHNKRLREEFIAKIEKQEKDWFRWKVLKFIAGQILVIIISGLALSYPMSMLDGKCVWGMGCQPGYPEGSLCFAAMFGWASYNTAKIILREKE